MIAKPENIFQQYDISRNTGFLPEQPPNQRLKAKCYDQWEAAMVDLPESLRCQRLRKAMDEMPIISTSGLNTEEDWRRAYCILSFLTHGYIWGGGMPAQVLPPSISVPFLEVADHFGLPSTATYSALNLWNWTPTVPGADITNPDNIRMLHTFTGTVDEEWFYAVSVAIEAEGAKLIPMMAECFEAIQHDDSARVTLLVQIIGSVIEQLGNILDRMHENCNPQVFYHNIRPFLAGSKGMSAIGLPRGVFYDEGEGIGSWRSYSGGSNAQSSLIQLMDIMLGIQHHATGTHVEKYENEDAKRKHGYIEVSSAGTLPEFFTQPLLTAEKEMRRYMPQQHSDFLQYVTCIANIRPYATSSCANAKVQEAYKRAVINLTTFRDKHINIVARYVIAPSRMPHVSGGHSVVNLATASCSSSTSPANAQAELCGTGGTDLMPFLKQTRDETREAAGR